MKHIESDTNLDAKLELCKDISSMALIEINVCLILLLVSTFIFKSKACTAIASIGLIGSTLAFTICTYKYRKISNLLI